MPLTVVINKKRLPKMTLPEQENIIYHTDLLTEDEVTQKMNQHGIHLCPSEAEGFGHYFKRSPVGHNL